MNERPIPSRSPVEVQVTAGETYWWCSCGRSATQPFCDGSHKGTEDAPVAFTPEADGTVWLCACKRTGGSPHCDGSHNSL